MNLSHRIRLYPNNKQATYLTRAAGIARFAWNWGLARWNDLYKAEENPSWQKLNAELNSIKRNLYPWMLEVTKWAPNKSLNDLGSAFRNFFRRVKKGENPGYPRFKKKGRCTEGFYVAGMHAKIEGQRIWIPKLGWVRMAEPLRLPGRVFGVRFKKKAGKWFVSAQIELDETYVYPHRCENQAAVGVDLGLVQLAIPSKGEPTPAPRKLRYYEKKLKRLQRELARRTQGGSNWKKTRLKIQKLYERITNIRRDVTHKLTSSLVKNFRWVGIEDLSVKGMLKNRRLAKSVMDASFYEVRRQLEYKATLSGSTIVIANRWFPSSKKCSSCGSIFADLQLSQRSWICSSCGSHHDRDLNAALNLEKLAAGYAVNACGEGSSGSGYLSVVKLPSVKQESSL